MKIKGYTQRQWAILILRYDFRLTYRKIAEILNVHKSTVKYVVDMERKN